MSKTVVLLMVTLLAGCSLTGINPNIRYPIIQVPQRPQLHVISEDELRPLPDDTIRRLVENDDKLKRYIEQLEAAIDTYNKWAKENSK